MAKVKVSELRGKNNIPIVFYNTEVPAFKSDWDSRPKQTIVFDKALVISSGFYSSNITIIQLVPEGGSIFKARSLVLPNDFMVELMEGEEAKSYVMNYKKENLAGCLHHNFTIGSDPEIFVEDSKGLVLPAFTFLNSKDKAKLTKNVTHGNTKVYWDGFQAEFETYVGYCLGWLSDSTQYGLEAVLRYARQVDPQAKLSAKTVMNIPIEMLSEGAEEHVSLGCMPSFNIYGSKGADANPRQLVLRPAGGHIHFGIGKQENVVIDRCVKALDAILGVACVSLFAKWDHPVRRQYYGLAGEYRLPPHGLEYRTLSNAWLYHPAIKNLVFDIARKALMVGMKDYLYIWEHDTAEVINTINTCDVDKARESLTKNKEVMLQIIRAAYQGRSREFHEAIFNIFMNGMESVIKDPTDIEGNWNLTDGKWVTHANLPGKNVNSTILAMLPKDEKKAA